MRTMDGEKSDPSPWYDHPLKCCESGARRYPPRSKLENNASQLISQKLIFIFSHDRGLSYQYVGPGNRDSTTTLVGPSPAPGLCMHIFSKLSGFIYSCQRHQCMKSLLCSMSVSVFVTRSVSSSGHISSNSHPYCFVADARSEIVFNLSDNSTFSCLLLPAEELYPPP